MLFLLAGVLLSFVNSIKEIFIKHTLKKIDTKLLVGIISLFSSFLMLPFVIKEGIPHLSNKFYLAFISGGILYFIGKFFYFEALKKGEISFISPLKGLVTVNVVFTSWLLLGEIPSINGLLGILIVSFGVYLLSIQKGHIKLFEPIKHLFTDKGSRLYLITALAYGFTVTIDKIGVLETSPFFWGLCMNMFLFFVTLPYLIKKSSNTKKLLVNNYKQLSGLIVLHTAVYIGQMYIIQYILASYTSTFKSASALFAVIIGGIFFKEKDLKKKFFSALLILIGIILIIFS